MVQESTKRSPPFGENDPARESLIGYLRDDMGLHWSTGQLDDKSHRAVMMHATRQIKRHRQERSPFTMGDLRSEVEAYVAALRKGEITVPELKGFPHMDEEELAAPDLLDTWLINKLGWPEEDDDEWDKLERKVLRRYFLFQVDHYRRTHDVITLGELNDAASYYGAGYQQCLCDMGLRVADGLYTVEPDQYGGI